MAEHADEIKVPPGDSRPPRRGRPFRPAVATRVLERTGFEVTACEDGQEAIEVLESGERFSLLITDVVMPRASGRELADRAKEIDAWMPVLYMSGYTEDIISSHDVVTKDMAFLRKPFTARDLLETVGLSLGLTQE